MKHTRLLRKRFSAMPASPGHHDRPNVKFYPEDPARPEQYRRFASGTPGQKRKKSIENAAQQDENDHHQMAGLKVPDADAQQKERRQQGKENPMIYRPAYHTCRSYRIR